MSSIAGVPGAGRSLSNIGAADAAHAEASCVIIVGISMLCVSTPAGAVSSS